MQSLRHKIKIKHQLDDEVRNAIEDSKKCWWLEGDFLQPAYGQQSGLVAALESHDHQERLQDLRVGNGGPGRWNGE